MIKTIKQNSKASIIITRLNDSSSTVAWGFPATWEKEISKDCDSIVHHLWFCFVFVHIKNLQLFARMSRKNFMSSPIKVRRQNSRHLSNHHIRPFSSNQKQNKSAPSKQK